MNETQTIADEKYEFKSGTRSKLFMFFGAGLLLFVIGVFMAMSAGSGEEHGKAHAGTEISKNLLVSTQPAEGDQAATEEQRC